MVTEPEAVAQQQETPVSPLWTVLREHGLTVLIAGGAFIANNVCFYIAITYAVAYGTATIGIPRETMLLAVMVGSLVMIPALIV
ncbi:MHS family MFS transporter, partial [Serratia marcescens]